MLLKDNLSNLILVIGTLIVGNDAGCKYTNPQWVSTDPTFMTAPSLHLTFNGVNEEDQVWLAASWNTSYVEKYPQCIDNIQVLVKKIKDPKTKKTLLCDLRSATAQNCTGNLARKDFCDETLDVWIRITNQDYKDGVQPIGAPSMTRIDNFPCGEPYTMEALGTFMSSQSCESLQPSWKSSPDFIIPEGIRGKRVVNMTWTNSAIENVICVDEVEVKYWEEGQFAKGYHKENAKITNTGSEDYEYNLELDVMVCKTYSYMMKAMKSEPYFVATYEGKFSSKCDETIANALSSTSKATPPRAATKTTSATTTTSEATEKPEEPTSSVDTKEGEDSSSTTTVNNEDKNEATSTTAAADNKETTAQEDGTTTGEDMKTTESETETTKNDAETSETTKSDGDHSDTTKSEDDKTETTVAVASENEFKDKNDLDDPKESVRSNVDSKSFTVAGETSETETTHLTTTMESETEGSSSNETTMPEMELNTSIITLSTGQFGSNSDSDDNTDTTVQAARPRAETETEEEDSKTTLMEEKDGTTNVEGMSTTESQTTDDQKNVTEDSRSVERGRFDSVRKEEEVSLTFEVTNETSIEGSMKKHGRILMETDDTAESNRNADQARALQFNPFGKNSAENLNSAHKSTLLVTTLVLAAFFV